MSNSLPNFMFLKPTRNIWVLSYSLILNLKNIIEAFIVGFSDVIPLSALLPLTPKV